MPAFLPFFLFAAICKFQQVELPLNTSALPPILRNAGCQFYHGSMLVPRMTSAQKNAITRLQPAYWFFKQMPGRPFIINRRRLDTIGNHHHWTNATLYMDRCIDEDCRAKHLLHLFPGLTTSLLFLPMELLCYIATDGGLQTQSGWPMAFLRAISPCLLTVRLFRTAAAKITALNNAGLPGTSVFGQCRFPSRFRRDTYNCPSWRIFSLPGKQAQQ